MKICPTCNKEFPDDQKFCKYDGTPLEEKKAEAESGKKCPKCGRTYPADAGFCMTCGAKLVALDEKSLCASCGAELPEGAAFCMKCGAKAGESGESVEEKISTRDLSEIDENHLEKYDLPTLCWARYKCRNDKDNVFFKKLNEFIKFDDVLTEEEKTHDSILQFYLAVCYEFGIGCEEDKNQAFYWYKKSAEQGNASAQLRLAFCYRFGTGCEEDKQQAIYWYKKSAEQGDASAQYCLAACYYNGRGCEEDKNQAFYWYKKSAEQGEVDAQLALAECFGVRS